VGPLKAISLRRPVHDLGTVDVKLPGIMSPGYSDADPVRHFRMPFRQAARSVSSPVEPFPNAEIVAIYRSTRSA
jgi:hypothetical protein